MKDHKTRLRWHLPPVLTARDQAALSALDARVAAALHRGILVAGAAGVRPRRRKIMPARPANAPNLLGALPHLPALALQAARALLLPLPAHLGMGLFPGVGLVAHAAAQAEHEVEGRLLLNVVVREGAAILELLAREDQALLVGRDALLVLDLGLDVVNRVRRLHLESDRLARQGLDEDLHRARPPRAASTLTEQEHALHTIDNVKAK